MAISMNRLYLIEPKINILNSFYFLGYTKYRESIAFAQKVDFQILMNVHVLRATESKKVIFGMSSVCLWPP